MATSVVRKNGDWSQRQGVTSHSIKSGYMWNVACYLLLNAHSKLLNHVSGKKTLIAFRYRDQWGFFKSFLLFVPDDWSWIFVCLDIKLPHVHNILEDFCQSQSRNCNTYKVLGAHTDFIPGMWTTFDPRYGLWTFVFANKLLTHRLKNKKDICIFRGF